MPPRPSLGQHRPPFLPGPKQKWGLVPSPASWQRCLWAVLTETRSISLGKCVAAAWILACGPGGVCSPSWPLPGVRLLPGTAGEGSAGAVCADVPAPLVFSCYSMEPWEMRVVANLMLSSLGWLRCSVALRGSTMCAEVLLKNKVLKTSEILEIIRSS